jgi:hypothetical protein
VKDVGSVLNIGTRRLRVILVFSIDWMNRLDRFFTDLIGRANSTAGSNTATGQ